VRNGERRVAGGKRQAALAVAGINIGSVLKQLQLVMRFTKDYSNEDYSNE
jgi:hypothetical protein